MIEEEIAAGRRAFPKAQELLAAATSSSVAGFVQVAWHGSTVHPETGAFALVAFDDVLADLVGDVLKVVAPSGNVVFVYVLGARDVAAPLSLTRRAFLALDLLARSPLTCTVEVV